MNYCFCNTTAFDILQRLESIPNAAYESDSAAVLVTCGMSNISRAKAYLDTLSIASKEIHFLTANPAYSNEVEGQRRHVITAGIRPRSVFQLDIGLFCTSPEETYLNLAQSLIRSTSKDLLFQAEAKLALYAMELCGLYYHDSASGLLAERRIPLTTRAKIKIYLGKCDHRPGVELARKALIHVEDRTRSPMEASCALLLCRTRRIGSMGLPVGEINGLVETSEGPREVDRLWKRYGLGYEYQGRVYHTEETRRQEDRRRNALLGSGITIVNIWYEDISHTQALNNLAQTFSKRMGKRLRIRDESFAWRQQALRTVALPAINRYEW